MPLAAVQTRRATASFGTTILEEYCANDRCPAYNSRGAKSPRGVTMFFLQEGFTFRNFVVDAFTIFVFIVWFWLLISVASDLFRRHDVSGWAKAIWVIVLVVAPYIGVLAYLIFQGRGMAGRNLEQAQAAREALRREFGFSPADEIEKLDRLKKAGSISDAEFTRLRAKLVT
jgi:hypothetical protein